MNSQLININKITHTPASIPFVKMAEGSHSIEARQLVLIVRIMFSIFTIGLIGYTLDRFLRSR